ncbi:class I SAM-dependent methyltransferase [Catelliglobosispora koreensis]|uniref:class I SAM-dependent methyltransferase n=1 Tax=Catelliglobosispora koreensis TaxID=129052 RepID=UPI00035C4699
MGVQSRAAGPRTAVIWAVLRAELAAQGRAGLTIVDVGGGTGGFAVPLAEAGHTVTVVDPSPDALAALLRRAADAGVDSRVKGLQGDADSLADLVPEDSADLVLCHAVLEVVDDPGTVASALARTLRPGGAASVLVGNRAAAVLSRAIGGQFKAAQELLAGGGRRFFTADEASALLGQAGLTTEKIHGVRVVADLVPGVVADNDPEALTAFELATAALAPYRDVATQLHLLARR